MKQDVPLRETLPPRLPGRPRKTVLNGRVGLIALVGVGVFLALIFPFPVGGRLWSELFNLAHAPVFCGLVLLVSGFLDPSSVGLSRFTVLRPVRPGEVLLIAGACLAIGLVGELLQAAAGRSPSLKDMLANTAGVVSAVLWIASCRTDGILPSLLTFGCVLVLMLAVVRPISGIISAIRQRAEFPPLESFEPEDERDVWQPSKTDLNRTSEDATHGDSSLILQVLPGDFAGATMIGEVRDGSQYTIFLRRSQ